MKKGIVFVDRDGTLIKFYDYFCDVNLVELNVGMGEAIAALNRDFAVVVVTNQPGIAKGKFSIEEMKAVHKTIDLQLVKFNAHIDKYYYCPHHEQGIIPEYSITCNCRKPRTGMLQQAVKDLENGTLLGTAYKWDKDNSCMIGDTLKDLECGNNFGIKTFIFENDKTRNLDGHDSYEYKIVSNGYDIIDFILGRKD